MLRLHNADQFYQPIRQLLPQHQHATRKPDCIGYFFQPPDPLAREYLRNSLVEAVRDHLRANVGNDQIAAKRGDLSRLHIERNGVPLRIEPRLGGRIGDLVDGSEAALRRKTKSPGSRRVRTAPGLSGSMEQERHLSFVTDRITQRI